MTELTVNINDQLEFVDAQEKQHQIVEDNPFIEIVDNESWELAKKRRTALVKGRTGIRKGEKAIASKLADFRALVKKQADTLVDITLPHEQEQQGAIEPYEAKKKEEKEVKERKRMAQLAEWQTKAANILVFTDYLISPKNADVVLQIIKSIEEVDTCEDNYGSYSLIAEENKTKVLAQAKEVYTKLVDQEQEEEKVKAEELVSARTAYRNYFDMEYNATNDAATLLKCIEDDKTAKLERLEELEAKEKALTEQQEKESIRRKNLIEDYLGLSNNGLEDAEALSNEELSLKIATHHQMLQTEAEKTQKVISAKQQKELKADRTKVNKWCLEIQGAFSNAPEKLKSNKAKDAVLAAEKLLDNVVDLLNDL